MKHKYIFLAILLLAVALRFFRLDSIPSILNRDEAALAYNGYLLSETGKDEWGKAWPLSLESFGDFKLPGYPVVLSLLFKIVPETDFWVRFPSAVSGVGLVAIAFLFARAFGVRKNTSLLLSACVATAPVFIFYSRVAFEANVGLFLFVSSLLLVFLDSKRASVIKKVSSLLLYLFSVFTYNTPLLLGVLVVPLFWKRPWPLILGWIGVTLFAFLSLQLVFAQKQNITLFSDQANILAYGEYRNAFIPILRPILGSEVFFYGGSVAKNIFRSFSPRFLVTQGGAHSWHSVPHRGHLYWWQFGAAIVGILFAIKVVLARGVSKHKKEVLILLYLLLISLAPASITTDAPHATRSLLFFFMLLVFAVWGFDKFAHIFGKWKQSICVVLLVVSLFSYAFEYFTVYPKDQAMFQPGFERVLETVAQKHPNEKIAVVDGGGYQYILTSWYGKISPELYFSTIVRQAPNQIGFRYGQQVGNFHFIANAKDRTEDETVLLEWTGKDWALINF